MDLDAVRQKHFPVRLPNGYSIETSSKPGMEAIIRKQSFELVFPRQEGSFHFSPSEDRRVEINRLKERYQVLHHEWFIFKDPSGRPVGWHMGEAEDHATFYMRNTGVLPEHQNKGLYRAFVPAFVKYLAELGYERISSQHKATNRRILITKLRQGFNVAGLELTENWGPLVKLVYLVAPDRRDSFGKQYGE